MSIALFRTQLTKKLTEDKEAFRIKRKRLEERMKQVPLTSCFESRDMFNDINLLTTGPEYIRHWPIASLMLK